MTTITIKMTENTRKMTEEEFFGRLESTRFDKIYVTDDFTLVSHVHDKNKEDLIAIAGMSYDSAMDMINKFCNFYKYNIFFVVFTPHAKAAQVKACQECDERVQNETNELYSKACEINEVVMMLLNNINKFYIFGKCNGAGIAIEMALLNPEKYTKLFLVLPAHIMEPMRLENYDKNSISCFWNRNDLKQDSHFTEALAKNSGIEICHTFEKEGHEIPEDIFEYL